MNVGNILRVILPLGVLGLAGYGLITNDYSLMPLMIGVLGVLMLTMGFVELKKSRKSLVGYGLLTVTIYTFFVLIEKLFLI